MKYQIRIKKTALKQLLKIPDYEVKKINKRIESLAENPFSRGCKKLKSGLGYGIVVGKYRVIYTVEKQILTIEIIRIKHRKDAYKKLK